VRPTSRVHVDDGWHNDRDLSVSVGRWGWLHVRTLVEEHDRGRCLCRVSARLQPNVHGVVRAVLVAVALVAATSAAIALRWPTASLAAVVVASGLMLRASWQALRSLAVVDQALARVGTQAGLVALRGPARARQGWQPATRLQKGQAVTAALLAVSTAIGGVSLWQDRTSPPPQTHRPIIRSAAPPPMMTAPTMASPLAARPSSPRPRVAPPPAPAKRDALKRRA